MYSSEKNPGINWKDLIVKLIFFVIFVLILMWLFPKVPNMTPFYSNVFRENVSYMQDAAKSYYTNERLPKNIGDMAEMTLQDMIDKNLIIPFVDKDGNPCDTNASYVQVTKESSEEYSLKVNLVCDTESSYIIEVLGCYDYCDGGLCEKESEDDSVATALEYQFKRSYETTEKVASCPSGYTLSGSLCKKTKTTTTDATPTYSEDREIVVPVKISDGESVKIKIGTLNRTINNQVPYECSSTTEQCTTTYVTETYSCPKTSTERVCSTTYRKESYDCNCVDRIVGGKRTTSCNTCYRSVPEQSCSNQTVTVSGTCERRVPKQVCTPVSSTGICYRNEASIEYYCPDKATEQTGSGSSLECFYYDTTEGKAYCEDSSATQIGDNCYSIVSGEFLGYKCDNGGSLSGKLCVFTSTTTKAPSYTTETVTKYEYKWSTSETLKGWERTGKTRSVAV